MARRHWKGTDSQRRGRGHGHDQQGRRHAACTSDALRFWSSPSIGCSTTCSSHESETDSSRLVPALSRRDDPVRTGESTSIHPLEAARVVVLRRVRKGAPPWLVDGLALLWLNDVLRPRPSAAKLGDKVSAPKRSLSVAGCFSAPMPVCMSPCQFARPPSSSTLRRSSTSSRTAVASSSPASIFTVVRASTDTSMKAPPPLRGRLCSCRAGGGVNIIDVVDGSWLGGDGRDCSTTSVDSRWFSSRSLSISSCIELEEVLTMIWAGSISMIRSGVAVVSVASARAQVKCRSSPPRADRPLSSDMSFIL